MCALKITPDRGRWAQTIRADYAELAHIESLFAHEAETSQKIRSSLQAHLQVLQSGDWIGTGAQAFYAEMSSEVLPAIQRMARAFDNAQQTTHKIKQVMQQAEQDAARVFLATGLGVASGPAGLLASGAGCARRSPT